MTSNSASTVPQDPALTARVAATLALVLVADATLVAVLASLLRPWFAPVLGGAPGVVGWVALVVPATAVLAWAQFRYARRETLSAVDARPVTDEESPELAGRLRRLAQTADVRPPTPAIADTQVPNSLTVGGLGSATVVVSTGLLDRLDGDELDAVLAHELAHLQNRDAAVMTLATFLPALASDDYSVFDAGGPVARRVSLVVAAVLGYAATTTLVSAPAFSFESILAFGAFVAFTALFAGVALGLLALPVVVLGGQLSRLREFSADRAGALLSGDPASMASALEKLDASATRQPATDVRTAGIRELCFLPHGLDAAAGSEKANGGSSDPGSENDPLAGLPLEVETHPPTEERIARLRELQAEAQKIHQ
jgi:heat shock protein HtpX